jgi:hypothetical protein
MIEPFPYYFYISCIYVFFEFFIICGALVLFEYLYVYVNVRSFDFVISSLGC